MVEILRPQGARAQDDRIIQEHVIRHRLLCSFGDVEKAEKAALGGEGMDGRKELLEAGEILRAFDGLEGLGVSFARVVPALGDGCGVGGGV